jgi:hypothetical protein
MACALALGLLLAVPASADPGSQGAQEEEVDLDALDEPGARPPTKTVTRVPEHDYDRRLAVFPLLLVLILAWNVKWRQDPAPKKAGAPAPKEGPS